MAIQNVTDSAVREAESLLEGRTEGAVHFLCPQSAGEEGA